MSAEFFAAAVSAPVLLAVAGVFVFFVTRWIDNRDRVGGR
jgi:hypothetical protein